MTANAGKNSLSNFKLSHDVFVRVLRFDRGADRFDRSCGSNPLIDLWGGDTDSSIPLVALAILWSVLFFFSGDDNGLLVVVVVDDLDCLTFDLSFFLGLVLLPLVVCVTCCLPSCFALGAESPLR